MTTQYSMGLSRDAAYGLMCFCDMACSKEGAVDRKKHVFHQCTERYVRHESGPSACCAVQDKQAWDGRWQNMACKQRRYAGRRRAACCPLMYVIVW